MANIIYNIPGFLRAAANHLGGRYSEVLAKGCDERGDRPVSLSHSSLIQDSKMVST